jgi:hypothetical protein
MKQHTPSLFDEPTIDMTKPPADAPMVVAPSRFLEARDTSALAAVANQPRRGTQNEQLLELLRQAGDHGLADPEIAARTGWSRQTICVRRFDLRALIEPSQRRAQAPSGRWCVCWRLKKENPS